VILSHASPATSCEGRLIQLTKTNKMYYLSTNNSKIEKGVKQGWFTAGLSLAPHKVSGVMNVCSHASPACIDLCINLSGMGVFNSVQNARIRKTKEFAEDPKTFLEVVASDIKSVCAKAEQQLLRPAVRLNMFSDLPWETLGGHIRKSLMERFPGVQFYDYTKNPNRAWQYVNGKMPSNYSLTFSLSETNKKVAMELLATGKINVAMVFAIKRNQELPMFYGDYNVVDGDKTDLRFLDPIGVVVGLRAKGKAVNSKSKFVHE
jgi:hypothetical protein